MLITTTSTCFLLKLLLSIFLPSPATSQTCFDGSGHQDQWLLLHPTVGISAMHMQLLHDNKVLIFDRTDFGRSRLSLPTGSPCRNDPADTVLQYDCTAHSALYDIASNTFRPLMILTDTWCSSGSLLPDGTLLQTGGYNDGDHVVRTFSPCSGDQCDWVEYPGYLLERRWYATNQILPDGSVIILGGRRQFSYEFYPRKPRTFFLNFLQETRDSDENNLYPFLHLLPDGNLFVFANTRAISLDYKRNRVVREFARIPDGFPRNYPSSGSSVLLPIDENGPIKVEIMICGGAPAGAFSEAVVGRFVRASSTCGRLKVTDENPIWVMEEMPMARVMSDMVLLPTGDVLIINGAGTGTAGWEKGRDPVTRPVIYRPGREENSRFSVMCPSPKARLYHSTAVLLPDGRVLIGGSNPHVFYNFTGVEYPTDLSLEAYLPPYLSADYQPLRSVVVMNGDGALGYKQPFSFSLSSSKFVNLGDLSVRIVAPSFTTHSFGMNQRMVVLQIRFVIAGIGSYTVSVAGPSTPEIAPPGYYMMFVVNQGIPGTAVWVKLQ
ncbi:aldehyde oxidase GLOX [Diospyros lotus]|uniref:aldehyde oxidase GLOX n=1 Tax=Diospyros lotus TaxID=55363 RepID=UPI002251E89E|nr:aldehyde oxidase GLOX [Diospyros lotus]